MKLESTREQLEAKCKQTEVLDAMNIDLERELAQQRRDNKRDRQRIKEYVLLFKLRFFFSLIKLLSRYICVYICQCLSRWASIERILSHYFIFRLSDLYEKTRKQYFDIEHEYEDFRLKQLTTQNFPKSSIEKKKKKDHSRQLSRSYSLDRDLNLRSSSDDSPSTNLFDLSSNSLKSHLTEFKSRIQTLTIDCTNLTERLHQSEEDKRYLIDRITLLERQRRDENDSFETELNHYKKCLTKHSNPTPSPPEHELSLYDEVQFEQKPQLIYEATNYKDLFAQIYDKLKSSSN